MGTRYLRFWQWIMIIVPVGVVLYFLAIRVLPLGLAPGTVEIPNKCWDDGKKYWGASSLGGDLAKAREVCPREHCGAKAKHAILISNAGQYYCAMWEDPKKLVPIEQYSKRAKGDACVFSIECPQKKSSP